MNQLTDKDLELAKKHGIHDELKYYCHTFSSQELAAFLAERDAEIAELRELFEKAAEICEQYKGSEYPELASDIQEEIRSLMQQTDKENLQNHE